MALFKGTRYFLLAVSILAKFILSSSAERSAWNGQTTPKSIVPSWFTPFYVPPGAKAYDSSSPLVHYTGKWHTKYSSSYVGKSLRLTWDPNASIVFTFTGTGIEWFGTCDRRHGISIVYIDGQRRQILDVFCDRRVPKTQQRIFWAFDLKYGTHTIRITNTAKRPGSRKRTLCDLDAFIVTRGRNPKHLAEGSLPTSGTRPLFLEIQKDSDSSFQWTLTQKGATGVHAMQLAVISSSHAIIIDKVEHNPLTIDGHPAWAALYNLNTHAVRPLALQSNSFCAGGSFLGNGTLVNVGGNPVVQDHTSAADFGDLDGLQAIRLFHPCDAEDDLCEIYEDHSRIRLASPRWYNTVIRINDGSAMIIGGSMKGGWINNATVNNPTIEYFPPKSIHGRNGLPIHLPFLVDTLNSNLFPIAFSLPDGKVFMAANQDSMIYDWKRNKERRLPRIPNGVRVTYPMTGTGLLLPLSPKNDYQPEILLCGGSDIDDGKPSYEISSQDLASTQCIRMVLTESGISRGWQVELMPEARTMPDAVLLPTGKILIVNGAGSGISGYGNVLNQVGKSNANNPVLRPVLYDPLGPPGQRFSSAQMPVSQIPRMYHSVATLTPAGDVMVAGSNPNLDRSEMKYGTEYRVEWISPPYMKKKRPQVVKGVQRIGFGEIVKIKVRLGGGKYAATEGTFYQYWVACLD